MAERAGKSIKTFLKILTIYYQCDSGSYTVDAGGLHFLEHLFVYKNGNKCFDTSTGLLKFSPTFETKYRELEKVLLNEL